ncbi:MAG: hypothetical protein ACYDD1_00985, partial [Caulobacteraceae bacterium]
VGVSRREWNEVKWEDTPVNVPDEMIAKVLAYISAEDPAFWPSITTAVKWYSNLTAAKPRVARFVIESGVSSKLNDWTNLNFKILQIAYFEGVAKNGKPIAGTN